MASKSMIKPIAQQHIDREFFDEAREKNTGLERSIAILVWNSWE